MDMTKKLKIYCLFILYCNLIYNINRVMSKINPQIINIKRRLVQKSLQSQNQKGIKISGMNSIQHLIFFSMNV